MVKVSKFSGNKKEMHQRAGRVQNTNRCRGYCALRPMSFEKLLNFPPLPLAQLIAVLCLSLVLAYDPTKMAKAFTSYVMHIVNVQFIVMLLLDNVIIAYLIHFYSFIIWNHPCFVLFALTRPLYTYVVSISLSRLLSVFWRIFSLARAHSRSSTDSLSTTRQRIAQCTQKYTCSIDCPVRWNTANISTNNK